MKRTDDDLYIVRLNGVGSPKISEPMTEAQAYEKSDKLNRIAMMPVSRVVPWVYPGEGVERPIDPNYGKKTY